MSAGRCSIVGAVSTWLVVVLIGACVLGALPAGAFACTRTTASGPSVAWPRRQIVLHRSGRGVDVDEQAIDAALAAAAAAWTDVPCSDVVVAAGAPTTARLVGFDWRRGSGDPANENVVVFRNDQPDDPLDAWVHDLGFVALTTVTFDVDTGVVVDADVEFNDTAVLFSACDPEDPACVVEFDLQSVMTHEFGHVLGLADLYPGETDVTESTMFAAMARGESNKRTLARDDEDGLCTLYPDGDPVAGECFGVPRTPSPVRVHAAVCGAGSSGGPLGLLFVLAALPVGRRSRLRPRSCPGRTMRGAAGDRAAGRASPSTTDLVQDG